MAATNIKLQAHNNQDYVKIRDDCLKGEKRLWEDPSYELSYDGRSDWVWKRPKEIVNNARFIKANIREEPSRFNINNLNVGESKDIDLIKHNLAVLSLLTVNPSIFRFVVPDDNVEFSNANYAGLFHFRFWRFGKFYDVVVDDRLPTRGGQLVSPIKEGQPAEFWPFILEKAYTKLCGLGESLRKTLAPELLVDLSGGISENYAYLGHTKKPISVDIESVLFNASEKESLVVFGKHWHSKTQNMNLKNVYCVRKAVYVGEEKSEQVLLLRVFMPFIAETKEWEGPWSEKSNEWQSIPEEKKNEIGAVKKYEFVMPFPEFSKHDWDIYIVHLNPQYIESWGGFENRNLALYSSSADGKWVKGVSSGGKRKEYLDTTFYLNPQYKISLTKPEADFQEFSLLISVMQKNLKSSRVPMNIYIFELKQKIDERVDWDFFKHSNPMFENFPHDVTREFTIPFKVISDELLLVVSTDKPNEEALFILRVFANQKVAMSMLNEKVAQKDVDVRVSLPPSVVGLEAIPESDKEVWSYFEEVSGEDKVVGWKGLKKVLDFAMDCERPRSNSYTVRNSIISYVFPSNSVFDTMESKEFSKDLARSLLATADLDHSGKLTLQEFQGLWAQIRQWIQIYEMHSEDNGYMVKEQLREALDSAGFQLSSDILCSLAIRYSNRDNVIPFDDFIMCTSKLRTVFDYYRFKDPEFTDQAVFTLEEWLQKSIYS